ncbi:MAG: hypothetical protein CML22_07105 [Rheinheimera sp.]|nr:hypothetical protein [Rheinheimera sp.]MBM34052.1 hypothetical protein [Rheinheimera sp.]|tara:strand:+ start:2773 stop:3189 length:417 start_codon:yes stop_codon:yes gene_type:complete
MSIEQHHIYADDEAVSKNRRNLIIFFGLLFLAIAMFMAGMNFLGYNMLYTAAWSFAVAIICLIVMCVYGMFCEDFSELSVDQIKELSEALSGLPDEKRIFSEALDEGKILRRRDLYFVQARRAQVQRENILKSIQDLS